MSVKKIVGLALVAILGLSACSTDAESPQPSSSASTNRDDSSVQDSSSPSTTTESSSPPSVDPEPLKGAPQGPQQPTSIPTVDSLTDQDKEDAKHLAKQVLEVYGSGVSSEQWHLKIDRYLSNGYKKRTAKLKTEYLKFKVTGDGDIVEDPTINQDNPYWVMVAVPTDSMDGVYAVRLNRSAETEFHWVVDDVIPYKTIAIPTK
jgi:hypothetical protein